MALFQRAALTPSTAVNDSDHGAVVRVAAGLCTSVMLLFLGARLFIRWPWRNLFGIDDAAAITASAFSLIQVIVTMLAVSEGLGDKAERPAHRPGSDMGKLVYVSDILFVVALFLAKFVVGLVYHRLSSSPAHSKPTYYLAAAPCVGGFASVILIAVPKAGLEPWKHSEASSESTFGCWIAVTALSNLVELGLIAFPVWLVKDLRMRRNLKVLVILAAWVRLPYVSMNLLIKFIDENVLTMASLIPISILRLLSISRSIHSNDFAFRYATTEIYTQAEMAYALVAATALCFRNFLQLANTGLLDMSVGTGIHTMYSGTGTTPKLTQTSERSGKAKGLEHVNLATLSQDQNIARADNASMASDSSQRNIVVRHTVDVQYSPCKAAD